MSALIILHRQLIRFAAGRFAFGCIKDRVARRVYNIFRGSFPWNTPNAVLPLVSGCFNIPIFHIAYGRSKLGHFELGRFDERCFTLVSFAPGRVCTRTRVQTIQVQSARYRNVQALNFRNRI